MGKNRVSRGSRTTATWSYTSNRGRNWKRPVLPSVPLRGSSGWRGLRLRSMGMQITLVRHRCIPVETRSSPRLISSLRFAASQTASQTTSLPRLVSLEVSPGSINVVPAEARLTIDVRSYDDDAVAELVDRVEGRSRPLATVKTFRTTSKRFGGSPHRVLAAGEPDGARRRRSGRSRSSGHG